MNTRTESAPLRRYGFLVLVAVAFATAQAVGQTVETPGGEFDISEERIQNLLSEIELDQALDADTKAKAVESCQVALRDLAKQKKAAENGQQFQQDAATAAETGRSGCSAGDARGEDCGPQAGSDQNRELAKAAERSTSGNPRSASWS